MARRDPPCRGLKGPSARRGRRAAGAFTLVELLVVVGIIGLLLSLLVPGLTSAREHAYATVCKSRLRQMWETLQSSENGTLELPPVLGWRDTIAAKAGPTILMCPKDHYEAGTWADLDKLYFVQNGRTFCYLTDVMAGVYNDGQIRFTWMSDVEGLVTYGGGGSAEGACAACIIKLGDPVTVTVPDHVSHADRGGCGSNHWVCYGEGGSAGWESDIILQMKGVSFDHVDPRSPAVLGGIGTASYAMNVEVPRVPARPDQILLLEYDKSIADVHGVRGPVDDWETYLVSALRHFDKANVVSVDGRVRPMTRQQLQWERDRADGAWRP